RNRPRHEHRRANDASPAKRTIHRQRERESQHQLDAHADGSEERGVTKRLPKARVAENRQVVAESYEGTPEPRHAQIVLVERLPGRPAKRKERDEENASERRRGKEPAYASFRGFLGARSVRHPSAHFDVARFCATSSLTWVRS